MATTNGPARLTVTGIGALDETTVAFERGVTVLTAGDAADRTSLVRSLATALGSDEHSLDRDADIGDSRVELVVGGDRYTRTFAGEDDRLVASVDPFLDDSTGADRFAFLLGSNEARRAVADERDLRKLVMHSVDTDAVYEELADRRAERAELDDRIGALAALEAERRELRDRRDELDAAIERLEAELADRQATLAGIESAAVGADTDAEVGPGPDANGSDTEARQDRRRELTAALDDIEFELEAERESLDALDAEIDDIESKLDSYTDDPTAELDDLTDELAGSRARKWQLDADITDVQRTLQFNEQFLTSETSPVAAASEGESDDESDGESDDGDRVVCWTCGTSVPEASIESTLDQLRTLRDDRREERAELAGRIERLQERRSELEGLRERRRDLETRREERRRERADRRARVEDLEARRDDIESDIADLKRDAESTETGDRAALLDAHREVNRVEFELERRREERDAVVDELEALEAELDRRADLEARQDEIDDRIDELRDRIERLERATVSGFNDRIADVLDALEHDRLARVWVERRSDGDARGDGRPTSRFVLHIERRTDDGKIYEDVIDHLAESERELVGLVFALAGHSVHEVYDDVPFLVFDSLGAIDADHTRTLIDYARTAADYLVVALPDTDAPTLSESYRRVRVSD
ncbi:archaea-specific SMC-related protein [Haloferax sulfurifontis]|uniref:SMC-like protein Sph4 n=1 Tax=Haloferax sulfurifontis ATCC BAA-897 TaxID=662480 RepID=M0IK62_9EURY|nr:archaea-specific SMC-related protein [Haloferax sulfurifontis]ELZ96427.1 SMC-like protein Sph4 [Haloferax sulfurifontis ATCC BAA-897]